MIPMAPLLTYVLIMVMRTERFDIWRALRRAARDSSASASSSCRRAACRSRASSAGSCWASRASSFYALQNLYIALRSPPDADALTQTTGMLILGGLTAIPLAAGVDGFLLPVFPMTDRGQGGRRPCC